jgi:hypothetical protein
LVGGRLFVCAGAVVGCPDFVPVRRYGPLLMAWFVFQFPTHQSDRALAYGDEIVGFLLGKGV